MRESLAETFLGALVVAIAGAFLWFSLNTTSEGSGVQRYELAAFFDDVSGVERGTDVRMSGVKIGLVTEKGLDSGGAEARLALSVDQNVLIPADSVAKVVSDGLLGGAYVAIERGQSSETLPTDGTGAVQFTRGSVDLIDAFAAFANVDTNECGVQQCVRHFARHRSARGRRAGRRGGGEKLRCGAFRGKPRHGGLRRCDLAR